MKLFNKSRRIIGTSKGDFSPQAVVDFEQAEGERLLRLYQGEVVEAAQASAPDAEQKLRARVAELEATVKELTEAKGGDDKLKAENKALKDELADVVKASKELQKQLAEAEAVSNPESKDEGEGKKSKK